MDPQLKILMTGIVNAIDEIEGFLADLTDFTAFQNDIKTQRAVERNLETIGKAMKSILKKDPSIHFSNAEEIVAISKKLSKGREETFDQTLWGLIRRRTISFSKDRLFITHFIQRNL